MEDQLRVSEPQWTTLNCASLSARKLRARWWLVPVGTTIVLLLGVLILFLPAIGEGPRPASLRCGYNLQQVMVVIGIYAAQNQGAFPPSLQLLSTQAPASSHPMLFHCPGGSGAYVYLGTGMNLQTVTKDAILIYEPLSNHQNPNTGKMAMNILYGDGRVQLTYSPLADKIIAELNAGHNPPRAEKIR